MSNIPANDWALRRYPTEDVRTYPPDTLMRLNEVSVVSGKKKSSIYKAVADGEFPAPKKIGKRAVAWSANEVFRWMAERPSARQPDKRFDDADSDHSTSFRSRDPTYQRVPDHR